ncbi:hypothetical protein KHQ88_07555 [Mycoplasmatota bacterium]|nr:hypothetical protein KHQ88_07555 [Mycoplasmatota bacterium]
MPNIESDKAISKFNYKKALVFIARKKLFKPIFFGKTKSFTGYQTIGYFKANGQVTINVSFKISKGDAYLVIVQKRNLYKVSNTTSNREYTFHLEDGKAKFRLIANKANIEYQIQVKK